jgi:hypothetical protein
MKRVELPMIRSPLGVQKVWHTRIIGTKIIILFSVRHPHFLPNYLLSLLPGNFIVLFNAHSVAYPGICKWVKLVFLLGYYGCIFHGTGNSAQLCQNFGISVSHCAHLLLWSEVLRIYVWTAYLVIDIDKLRNIFMYFIKLLTQHCPFLHTTVLKITFKFCWNYGFFKKSIKP